jgi:hypothetical protein
LSSEVLFDFIFLDGLHTFSQTYRDFRNALKHLHPDGYILIDDVIPWDIQSANPNYLEAMQERSNLGVKSGIWHGDVFKLAFLIAKELPFCSIKTYVYPGNAQSLIKLSRTVPANEIMDAFNSDMFNRYKDLSFLEAFNNFGEVTTLLNFEFRFSIH